MVPKGTATDRWGGFVSTQPQRVLMITVFPDFSRWSAVPKPLKRRGKGQKWLRSLNPAAYLPLLFSVAVIQGRSHQAGQAERGFADKHLGQQLPGSGVGVFAQDAGIDGVLGLVDDGQKHQASDADAD